MPKARPRTGEKRKTRQPLHMDRLPPEVLDVILALRNGRGKTWDEISALTAEPVGKGELGFIDWPKLDAAVRMLFPKRRIPRTTLHRWYDLRVRQVHDEVMVKSEQARTIAESFAKSNLVNADEAVINAARDTLMGVLSEDGTAEGRMEATKGLIKLGELMQSAKTNAIRDRKVSTEERKIKLLEEREAIARIKLEAEAKNIERKRRTGSLKREDVERLVETVFGLPAKAA